MQTTAARWRLRGRQPGGQPAPAAAAAAGPPAADAAAADAAADASVCRICWQERDDEQGGSLLSPCRCSGSQRYVHARCLSDWMHSVAERKGAGHARVCDVCRSRYCRLPRDLRLPRESVEQFVRRQVSALMGSPAGAAASYYAAGGLVFSVALALRGAWCRLAALRMLVRTAQEQPLRALQLVGPDLALSVAIEGCLSGQWLVPLLSMGRLMQGFALRSAALWLEGHAAAALPRALMPLLASASFVAQLAANVLQYTHLGLLLLTGGLARGFAHGALLTVQAPARVVGAVGMAVWRAAAAAAGLLPPLLRRARRSTCGSSSGGSGRSSSRRRKQGQQQQQQEGEQQALQPGLAA